jgi:CRP/FNR family transcriptional regulator, cyclic AMP receptor protein
MAGADTGNQLPSLQDLGELRHSTQDILLTVSRTVLFQELEPTEIQFLARFMRVYRADKGAVVFREQERGDYMLLVAAGSIEVFKRDDHGQDKSMGVASQGKTLGEMSMIDDGSPRSATCIALQDSILVAPTRSGLEELVHAHPRFGTNILLRLASILSERLRRATAQLVEFLDV